MKYNRILVWIGVAMLLCLSACVCPAGAGAWWQSRQEGSVTDDIAVNHSAQIPGQAASARRINWEDGYIEVMAGATADTRDSINLAQAYSVALKTARHLAYEKLAETVAGVNLYSDATYDRELMMDSNLRVVVQGLIRNAVVVSESHRQFAASAIWAEVVLGLKLSGHNGLIQPSLQWARRTDERLNPKQGQSRTGKTATVPPPAPAEAYTGLIIDATGLGARPAMLPRVFSASGEVLYGTGDVDKDYVVKYGIMAYQSSVGKARRLERVGSSPLVVKARSVRGKARTDYVLSETDARRLRAADATGRFLRQCRVVAVLSR